MPRPILFYLSTFSVRFHAKNVQDNKWHDNPKKENGEEKRNKVSSKSAFYCRNLRPTSVLNVTACFMTNKICLQKKDVQDMSTSSYTHTLSLSLSLSLLIYWAICPHWKFNEFLYIDSHTLSPSHNHVNCEEQRAAGKKENCSISCSRSCSWHF